ncbi:T7SS effector LXG polymorphic toxin [Sporolactobacillus shoreicorticis]|uniref:T7SS effector LXG polymorphic toxin n=1 Tax=Sporolactobacillus shoreicorticis TaxID=1923877 RepID=A0ABW5S4X4_9BACL|nr:T7SS effector LXG polymorphic toxin [Sporolactobacillus shoreicorticis]MCO7125437.1 T7SS effector LXG polymorphic toxin [Sporolactobacillus shoreicorticis]
MRANLSGGSGSATDTQTYEAEALITAAKAHAGHYQTLRGQFQTLRHAFGQIEGLGPDFQGNGAKAIKQFYAAQVNVIDAWLRLIDKKIAYFQGVAGTIVDKKLGGDTQIQVPFLNEDLSMGYARSKERVREQRADISKILSSISDLVPINVFSNQEVDQALDAADKKRAQTVLDVQDLDQNLTNEYRQVNEDLPYIASLYGELINATRQGADVQPMHFNAQAYHDSKIVQVQDEMEKETQNYLHYKQQQETVREMEKQREAEVNRPWYEKVGSAVATFAGELSGYYDYLRAVEGIDPETGRKLSAGERITAGAMAASTFIPIIGWGGRIAKGGAALYKTARSMEATGKALNAYDQANRTLKVLSQSEKGINALSAANGITQAATGRDLFGKQLTKDEQRNSLLQGVFMMNLFTRKLATSPAQKAIVHEQSQAFKEHVTKIVHNAREAVNSSKREPAMAGGSNDFAKVSNGSEDIAKTHRMAKSESDVAKANQLVKNTIEGLTSSATKGYKPASSERTMTREQWKSWDRERRIKTNYPKPIINTKNYEHVKSNPNYYNSKGEIIWPPNQGVLGSSKTKTIEPGTIIDRFGYEAGTFVSPYGVPYEMRSLAPETYLKPYNVYVIKKPIEVQVGKITPWFDELGLGTQYELNQSVKNLIDKGIIGRIGT